jgi:hypothetical protein
MGTWGPGLFDDDLALDVKGTFDRAVAGGASPADAATGLMESELAREILGEFGADERDDMFWEENRGLFYAIASLQLEHGVLQEVVRQQTLQAIAVERRGLDPEQNRERWELLDALEAKLNSGAAEGAPLRNQLAEGTNPALQVEAVMAKPPAKRKPAARKPAPSKPAAKKPAARKLAPKKPAPRKPAPRTPAPKPAPKKPAPRTPAPKPAPSKPAARKPAPRKPAPRKGRKA